MANAWLESLGKMIMPLLVDYGTGQMPEALRRLLFVNVVALGTEGQEWLKKTQTQLDDSAFAAMIGEAIEAFGSAGLSQVPAQLDGFVAFAVPA